MDHSRRQLMRFLSSLPILSLTETAFPAASKYDMVFPLSEGKSKLNFQLSDAVSAQIFASESRGYLDEREKKTLWNIFLCIGRHWQLASLEAAWEKAFMADVDLKTSCAYAPSYFSEYKHAIYFFEILTKQAPPQLGNEEKAQRSFANFVSVPKKKPDANHVWTRMDHIRVYVVSEFCHLYLAYGGFKPVLNAKNYRGYLGGPNTLTPPFRT